MSYFLAIVGLGVLIMLHEGGHFIVARWCKMRVERFSLGFGPTLWGFKRGETVFQIAPIPFGGFVQITGLNPGEEFDRSDPFVYPNRPAWMRLATLLAGPIANYLTAFVLILFVFVFFGVPSKTLRVDEVIAGTPAAAAGLRANDVLIDAEGQKVSADAPINNVIRAAGGRPVRVTVERQGKPVEYTIKPERKPSGDFQIGIRVAPLPDRDPVPVGTAVAAAARFPVVMSAGILVSLGELVRGKVNPQDVSGPVGITKQIAKAADNGIVSFLMIIAMLSVYLGLFNLLPLPALDGGRAAFLAIGTALRRRINPFFEAKVHTVGFVLLFGLMLVVTFKDIFLSKG